MDHKGHSKYALTRNDDVIIYYPFSVTEASTVLIAVTLVIYMDAWPSWTSIRLTLVYHKSRESRLQRYG